MIMQGEKGSEWHMCPIGVKHEAQVEELQRRMQTLEKCIEQMTREIREIRDRLLGRPSWATTYTIMTLVGALTTCVMYILTHK
jgi:hypothetical protein